MTEDEFRRSSRQHDPGLELRAENSRLKVAAEDLIERCEQLEARGRIANTSYVAVQMGHLRKLRAAVRGG